MSRRNKLVKFTELLTFSNVFECFDTAAPKISHLDEELENNTGWVSPHFNNDNPIVLELACGHGDYSLALAQRYPSKNIIGVDVKGARIWKGALFAQEKVR